ncbi:hypothetical protein [Paraglaciecola aestuariivivens]
MSYKVAVEEDHVYVKYLGLIDGLDIIRMAADNDFVNQVRRLQTVVHDFSFCDDVQLKFEDLHEVTVLANVESNFAEKLFAIIIPKTAEGYDRVATLTQGIKSPDWTVMVAQNYPQALIKIQTSKEVK